MQPLSNQEASYLLQDSYKKKMEMMEKKKKPIHIAPVYQDFLEYCKKFSQLKFTDDLDTDDIDPLRNKLIKIKKIRKEIEEKGSELQDIEMVQLWNLTPSTFEEAMQWIPSLDRFQEQSKEAYIVEVLKV